MKMVTGIGAGQTAHTTMVAGTGTNGSQITMKESSKSDRRSNKPIMEKRRRARINNCLNELKTLILDATKKDPARHSKLEKADILEKTVKYLQDLQRQQAIMTQAADPKVVNKFKVGFSECANEVSQFPGIDPVVRRRLLQHLSICMNGVKMHDSQSTSPTLSANSIQINALESPPSSPEQGQQNHTSNQSSSLHCSGYFLPRNFFALVVPQSISQNSQLPTLVPIPTRTSSTSSSASASCSVYERLNNDSPNTTYTTPSPTQSYELVDYKPSVIKHGSSCNSSYFQYSYARETYSPSPMPLSLVVKKERDEEQPWRPW